jgi:hypothetical protein
VCAGARLTQLVNSFCKQNRHISATKYLGNGHKLKGLCHKCLSLDAGCVLRPIAQLFAAAINHSCVADIKALVQKSKCGHTTRNSTRQTDWADWLAGATAHQIHTPLFLWTFPSNHHTTICQFMVWTKRKTERGLNIWNTKVFLKSAKFVVTLNLASVRLVVLCCCGVTTALFSVRIAVSC